MERLSCKGWTFSFHRDRTRRLNRTLPQARPEIRSCLPELGELLEQLGLDLQRPVSRGPGDGVCYLFWARHMLQMALNWIFTGRAGISLWWSTPAPKGTGRTG